MRPIIIEKNTGECIVLAYDGNDQHDQYITIVERWRAAHSIDSCLDLVDIKGGRHCVNSRRIIDIYEDEEAECPAQETNEADDYLNKNDQT